MDWINDILYFTDAQYSTARIEVLDLNTQTRAVLIETGIQSVPRSIAVDPTRRYILCVVSLLEVEHNGTMSIYAPIVHGFWPELKVLSSVKNDVPCATQSNDIIVHGFRSKTLT